MSDLNSTNCTAADHAMLQDGTNCPNCGSASDTSAIASRVSDVFRSEVFRTSFSAAQRINLLPIVVTLVKSYLEEGHTSVLSASYIFGMAQIVQTEIGKKLEDMRERQAEGDGAQLEEMGRGSIWVKEASSALLEAVASAYPDNPSLVAAASMNGMGRQVEETVRGVIRFVFGAADGVEHQEPAD